MNQLLEAYSVRYFSILASYILDCFRVQPFFKELVMNFIDFEVD